MKSFEKDYKRSIEIEFQRCLEKHNKIIDQIWKNLLDYLGPKNFLEFQKKYLKSLATKRPE